MKILTELRRRRVFRLAGLYIVGAWIVIEVASVFFPAWGIPDTALRYLFIAAALLFPVAIVFAWIFDITSDGIVRTKDAQPGEQADLSLTRFDYAVLVALATVAVIVILGSLDQIAEQVDQPIEQIATPERPANSIAILPFQNLDAQQDTEYFSDGVTEEILHRLSSARALQVIGRTSSFAFRDSADGPAKISEILGVAYLLHGSVRRDGDFVRVTARLLDQSGFQVWSKSFDRELQAIFVIQSEIASTVTNEIVKEIVPLAEQPDARTTQNMDAYNDYLVGKAHFNGRAAGWQQKAIAAYEAAITKDPGYAPPYAGIAVAMAIGMNDDPEHWASTEANVRKALELDPELADAHAALGLWHITNSDADPLAAIASLQRALELDPTLAIAYNWLAGAYNQLEREEESALTQRRGLEVDPLNPSLTVNYAARLKREGKYGQAEQRLLRLTNLPETPGLAMFELYAFYADMNDYIGALRWCRELARAYAGTGNDSALPLLAWTYARFGMLDEADYWLAQAEARETNPILRFRDRSYLATMHGRTDQIRSALRTLETTIPIDRAPALPKMFIGATYALVGNYERALELQSKGFNFETLERHVQADPLDMQRLQHVAAWSLRMNGDTELANRMLVALEEQIGWFRDNGFIHLPESYELVGLNLVLQGDYDGALAALEQAVAVGWKNYYWLINDPIWSEAIEDPRIADLLAEVKVTLDALKAEVEAGTEMAEFREEVARLYAAAE